MGIGLSGVNALGIDNDSNPEIRDAVDFISDLRQAQKLETVPVGREVVVVGGGMTAVDAAVQSKLLGAEKVYLVYRRSRERMSASKYEQDLATANGVNIITNAKPRKIKKSGKKIVIDFTYTKEEDGKLEDLEEGFEIKADQVLKAIGQTLVASETKLEVKNGKISVDEFGRTNVNGIWAGGDCAFGGDDLTVTAVAEGRDAAENINKALTSS